MWTELKGKVARAYEAADLTLRLTSDAVSRIALLSCYAGVARDPNNTAEVSLGLSLFGMPFPIRMRKSDIFTLSEIFFAREYATYTRLPNAPLVVDCGANVGLSAIWFLARCPGSRVHAFEPEPDNFRMLEQNLGSRSDVVLRRAALGRERGMVELALAEHGAMHSVKDRSRGGRRIAVPSLVLADYLAEHQIDQVDLLKLDVEGSELDVLEGLEDRIRDVKVIVGEIHEQVVDEDAVYRYLESNGFRRVKRRVRQAGTHLFEAARAS